jgi:glutathione-regulated potassium-efflux system ancillary protein KefC/glutathione-regulated potassium-efflux system protein KefB
MRIGVKTIKRETFESALGLGVSALELLGNSEESAKRAGQLFSEHDRESMHVLSEVWGDDHSYGVAVKQRMELLKQVLVSDEEEQDKIQTCQKSPEA